MWFPSRSFTRHADRQYISANKSIHSLKFWRDCASVAPTEGVVGIRFPSKSFTRHVELQCISANVSIQSLKFRSDCASLAPTEGERERERETERERSSNKCRPHISTCITLGKGRKGRYYFVSDCEFNKSCQTQSFLSNRDWCSSSVILFFSSGVSAAIFSCSRILSTVK